MCLGENYGTGDLGQETFAYPTSRQKRARYGAPFELWRG
jgi:hypothetical protein